jgi:hypothetical protein
VSFQPTQIFNNPFGNAGTMNGARPLPTLPTVASQGWPTDQNWMETPTKIDDSFAKKAIKEQVRPALTAARNPSIPAANTVKKLTLTPAQRQAIASLTKADLQV